MYFKNNKFYISAEDKAQLEKIVSMLCSPDKEQFALGVSLYQEIFPKQYDLWYVRYNSSITAIEEYTIISPGEKVVLNRANFENWIII